MLTAREGVEFHAMEGYIRKKRNTVTQYIALQSLLDLCEESVREPGKRVEVWRWDPVGINLAGAGEAATAAASEEEEGGEDWCRG